MPMPKNFLKAHKALVEQSQASGKTRKIEIKAQDGGARVNIYDEIGPWGVNASDFQADFQALNLSADSTVNVHINSPGGDVYDGLAIYQTLKASPATVAVYIDGLAASAASFIAMAGDTIEMGRNARMMIHDASSITYGNQQDHLDTAAWLGEESDNLADIYAQRAGGTAEEWRATMRAEKWYSSQQALAAGLIDSIHGADNSTTSLVTALFKGEQGTIVENTVTDPQEPSDDLDAILSAMKEQK